LLELDRFGENPRLSNRTANRSGIQSVASFFSDRKEVVVTHLILAWWLVAAASLAAAAQTPPPAAVVSAQAPSSNGEVDPKAVQSIRVKVIGCVAGDAKAGHYILTGAFLSGDDTPPTVGTAGKVGSGKDLSFEDSLSYDLIGGSLKAQVGHEVEIIGITSDARLNNSEALRSAVGSSKHERTTLTVDSVKRLAARCR